MASNINVFIKQADKKIALRKAAVSTLSGYVKLGNFTHNVDDAGQTAGDELGHEHNHVLYHHLLELAAKNDLYDLPNYEIEYPFATAVTYTLSAYTVVAEAAALTATAAVTPSTAINSALVFESSDPTVATVAANGNVTGVAAGKATITAMLKDNPFIRIKRDVTVTAE